MSEARDNVDEWVSLGLYIQRGATPDATLIDQPRPWLEPVLELLALAPPLGVPADLGRLLARAPFDIARSHKVRDTELRTALDAYEEHVLGRLAADFRLESARDALLRLDVDVRPAATAVFIEQVLARLRTVYDTVALDSPGPAAIRRVLHQTSAEILDRGSLAAESPEFAPLRAELTRYYAGLARAARRCGALIGDTELYTLENHGDLRSSSLRLAMAQISEAAQALERGLPVRVRRSDESRGRTPTQIEDESAYPIGGYASISTIGGIESLVSSELVYMNPPAERARGEVDLFEVRWAAGELLKYTRDESVHTRERRTLCFVFMPELDQVRLKDADVPFQRIVVVLGSVVAGIRKLCAWLDEAELSLQLVSVAELDRRKQTLRHPLAPELALTRLILREYIESGSVSVVELDSPDAVRAHAAKATETSACDLVWLQSSTWQPSEPATPGSAVAPYREHALSVERPRPLLWLEGETLDEDPSLADDGWQAWMRAVQVLMGALV